MSEREESGDENGCAVANGHDDDQDVKNVIKADTKRKRRHRSHSSSSGSSSSRSEERERKRKRSSRKHSRRSRSTERDRSHRSDRRGRHDPANRIKGGRPLQDDPKPNKCLGVFGMSLYTTDKDLQDYFGKFGPIEKVQLVYDHPTGRSRGFGFIYFENIEDAIEARESSKETELDGHRIRIDFSVSKRPHTPTPGQYMGRPRYDTVGMQPHGRRGSSGGGFHERGGYDLMPVERSYYEPRGGGYDHYSSRAPPMYYERERPLPPMYERPSHRDRDRERGHGHSSRHRSSRRSPSFTPPPRAYYEADPYY